MSPTHTHGGYCAAGYTRKRILCAALILGLASAFTAPQFARAAEPSEAPHIGEGGIPLFERVPAWAKVPAAWTHGAIGTDAVADEKNHIWLLTRPNSLLSGGVINRSMIPGAEWNKTQPQEKPKPIKLSASELPPSVIELDENGNVVQSWGGKSGKGYAWPGIEHTIAFGPKDSVLLMGYKDIQNFSLETQLLKFTKTGKFISAIGAADVAPGSNKLGSFNGPTGVAYYAKTNEYFVADGYMNNRVVVFDADSGKLKRMWGAYGNPPLDIPDRKPIAELGSAIFPPVLPPVAAFAERLQQFKDLHDIKISDDGLVYAADRGNRRIQVFTLEGHYVAEQFVGLRSPNEFQAISLGFSPDQRFLYVTGTPVVRILNRKTLELLGTTDIIGLGRRSGHHMAVDRTGNLFVTYGESSDPDGRPFGIGIQKYAFKGYSPSTKCCLGMKNVDITKP